MKRLLWSLLALLILSGIGCSNQAGPNSPTAGPRPAAGPKSLGSSSPTAPPRAT
jgi:hypothetical protein